MNEKKTRWYWFVCNFVTILTNHYLCTLDMINIDRLLSENGRTKLYKKGIYKLYIFLLKKVITILSKFSSQNRDNFL